MSGSSNREKNVVTIAGIVVEEKEYTSNKSFTYFEATVGGTHGFSGTGYFNKGN